MTYLALLKSARAALALQTEGDRLAREALAFVVDHTVTFAKVKRKPVAEVAVVDALAASLEVAGATGKPDQGAARAGAIAARRARRARVHDVVYLGCESLHPFLE